MYLAGFSKFNIHVYILGRDPDTPEKELKSKWGKLLGPDYEVMVCYPSIKYTHLCFFKLQRGELNFTSFSGVGTDQ